MDALWSIAGGVVLFLFIRWVIDVYRHRDPLDEFEILRLSRKRQRSRAFAKYDFSTESQVADPAEKKAMKSQGEFMRCDLDYRSAPARIAGLLKYKKHEWVVFGFIRDHRVVQLWWNKGPDGTCVRSFLRDHQLRGAIWIIRPDCIAIFHNHPNSNPSVYRTNAPSKTDLRSAGLYDGEFSQIGVTLLEFICERGIPHIYYASFRDDVAPIQPIIEEIRKVNGTGIFKNYSLRKELKQTTGADRIPGSVSANVTL